ncbi:MAG: ABC transporter ATP-binding protein [Chloroflexota bacterium]
MTLSVGTTEGDVVLAVSGLVAGYGEVEAVHGISLDVRQGEVVAIIGANGAGKSTTLKAISGMLRPRDGSILLRGRQIAGLPAERIVHLGLAHAPEGRRIFPGMTVDENLALGSLPARRRGLSTRADRDRVLALFPRLAERSRQLGWSLSGGEQQMLCIGRALMAHPSLLLMDEPSLGLAPILVRDLFRAIKAINAAGTAILLVEQNARAALQTAHRAYLLVNGTIRAHDAAQRMMADPVVREAYLGGV